MKRLMLLASIACVLLSHPAKSQQRVTKDSSGNYVSSKRERGGSKPTGHTIVAPDGRVYPVFISVNGKLFYNRVSRNGNVYKCYIKVKSN